MTALAPVRIMRPKSSKARLAIKLPYRAGGGNYDLIKDICGLRTRPKWDRAGGAFRVARSHLPALVKGLLAEFGAVELITFHYHATYCVSPCWNAKDNDDGDYECECSCCGFNHATGVPIGDRTFAGYLGEVSVVGEYLMRQRLITVNAAAGALVAGGS